MTVQALSETIPSQIAALDAFGPIGVRMQFAAGEEIYAQEEEADLIYQVIEGWVRTSRLLSDGRRQIGDFYYPDELFGMEAGDEHRFSAEALSDCTILVAKRSAVRHCGDERERLEKLIWAATTHELARTQEHLFMLGRKSACEKVASFLMLAAERVRGDLTTLVMSRQDMADYLGLTIETVSRSFTRLREQGVIVLHDPQHVEILDRKALMELASALH